MRVLVTGADGFVGRACCEAFTREGIEVVAAVRRAGPGLPDCRIVEVGAIDHATDWSRALDGVTAVVHLVARTHARDTVAEDAWARYRSVNVDATVALAEQCRARGVRRFVFASSIKVNGEASLAPAPQVRAFRAGDPPAPQDHYGRSKWLAEQALQAMAQAGVFEPVILRPPLIYGPGQKANLLRLMAWIAAGRPLPLAGVTNRRSLIYVGNFAAALSLAARRPWAGVQALPIADAEVSTTALARAMADALGVPLRLFACPALVLRALAALPRARPVLERLYGSLVIDASAARTALAWTPAVSFAQGMAETAAWFRRSHA